MQAGLVGNGKSSRLSSGVYGAANDDVPAVGVWRPLDEADRFVGHVYAPSKIVQKVGRCAKQIAIVHKAWTRKTKLCIFTQISPGVNPSIGLGQSKNRCRLPSNYASWVRKGFF